MQIHPRELMRPEMPPPDENAERRALADLLDKIAADIDRAADLAHLLHFGATLAILRSQTSRRSAAFLARAAAQSVREDNEDILAKALEDSCAK